MNAIRFALACACLAVPAAPACTVPVFRYALEKWKPSPYEVHVFHRGPLSATQQALVQRLEAAKSSNLALTAIDLAGPLTKAQETLWRLQGKDAPLPLVVVQYPEDDEKAVPVWTGPLDDASLKALLDSPARQSLVRHLTRGESAVWLLLESGDAKADDEAAAFLQRELKRLQSTIKLPVQDPADKLESTLPLRLSFVLQRVSRADAAESAFVKMLLGSDEELEKVRGPIAFPVFGRGRLLFGLHGAQLKPATVERWASFLCGPCSCQVKELNPGVDLLLTAAWQELLDAEDEEPTRPQATAPPIPPGKVAEEPMRETAASHGGGWLWVGLGVGAVVLLVAGARLLRSRGNGATP